MGPVSGSTSAGAADSPLAAVPVSGIGKAAMAFREGPAEPSPPWRPSCPAAADLPPAVSLARLREGGAALARVHALSMEPQAYLPNRPRPCAVDDRADERRRGQMPTTPLLREADERVRSHGLPAARSMFLHGDVWAGNMLWEGDRCVALIDWKTAGVGDPGVDLGSLRMQMALQYGQA